MTKVHLLESADNSGLEGGGQAHTTQVDQQDGAETGQCFTQHSTCGTEKVREVKQKRKWEEKRVVSKSLKDTLACHSPSLHASAPPPFPFPIRAVSKGWSHER